MEQTVLERPAFAQIKREMKREHRRITLRRWARNRLAITGFIILLGVFYMAVAAPAFYAEGPYATAPRERLQPPGAEHLLGTDNFGRDVLSRIAYGARISLGIGASVSAAALVLGMIVGLYASYYRRIDNVLMRICDGLTAIPAMLLTIAFMAVLGSGTTNVILSLAIVYTPSIARIARASALSVKEQTYIEAIRAIGAKPARIIWLHIAPNVLSPVIVQASFIFASAIITEAALSFLGVGVPVPIPSWGNILYEGKAVIHKAWWMVSFPGIVTALSVLGLNLIGDGLRDALDPYAK